MSGKGARVFLVATGLITVGLSGLVWRSTNELESARQEAAAVAERILVERARLEKL